MSTLSIRTYGDPVLTSATTEVTEIDGRLAALTDQMIETMYAAPGVGLAANQIGVSKRLFVYDKGDGPVIVINPVLEAAEGEWTYEEGCLSVPGLSWEIVRPNKVLVRGRDLDGNELELEAEEFEGRILQHEMDHLNGVLLVERLTEEQRKEAKRILRQRAADLHPRDPDGLTSLIEL